MAAPEPARFASSCLAGRATAAFAHAFSRSGGRHLHSGRPDDLATAGEETSALHGPPSPARVVSRRRAARCGRFWSALEMERWRPRQTLLAIPRVGGAVQFRAVHLRIALQL